MKKSSIVLLVVLSMLFSLSLTSCSSNKNPMVGKATAELKMHWKNQYKESNIGDGYFEIKNTRVVHIKENDIEMFENVKYIIEYEIYTDYYDSAPYYSNAGIHNNVVVYDDGSMSVETRYIQRYCNAFYNYDVSGFVDKVVDYNDEYNCVNKLN